MRIRSSSVGLAARYGALALLVNVGFVTNAPATSLADVLAATAALTIPPTMDEAAWRAWRATHETDLQRAHTTLALAHAVEEAVIATHQAAFATYGVKLVCNYDEEARPDFPLLVDRFIADGARLHRMTDPEARPRLLQTDITDMLPVALLSFYRCPTP